MKCFEYIGTGNRKCKKENCRYWIDSKTNKNCTLHYAKKESITLEDIGKIFKITRMRVCQIEKIAIKKIKEKILNSN
jgi:DNA-directed RNA polymerase sigma subunit (sigma70/sigma32)